MSTPSEASPEASPERRLHPASPVFVLISNLKRFALPIVILLITGRGDRNEWYSLIAVGVLALHSVARYITYRFHIGDDEIVIRSGVLQKSVRHIPFDRIQNVSLRQSLLHRAFGVAEVELESAGGHRQAEAAMQVLSLADAQAVEATVRSREQRAAVAGDAPVSAPEPQTLLELDTGEVLRLGLVSNRGLVLIVAALGVISQSSDALGDVLAQWTRAVLGWSQSLHLSAAGAVLGVITLAVVFLVGLYVLSAGLALARYHGFVLTDDGRRLRVERGLFTRVRGALQRRRIQAYTVRESTLHRAFNRRSLRVDSAAAPRDEERSLSELAPLASPEELDTLVRHLLEPRAGWPIAEWRPLHPRAWRRVFVRPVIYALLATAFAVLAFDTWGFVALAGIPLAFARARLWARYAAYGEEQGLIAFREGWLGRSWRFAEVRKLQVMSLRQTPFDRRHGMATLWMDTAGALHRPLRIPFLPEADARALRDRLAAAIVA